MDFTASAIDLLTHSRHPLQPVSAKCHSIHGVKAILQISRAGSLHRIFLDGARRVHRQSSEQPLPTNAHLPLHFSGILDPSSL